MANTEVVSAPAESAAADDFMKLVVKFMGELQGGSEGDTELRRRDPRPFCDVTRHDIPPNSLTNRRIDSWFDYMVWNLWELIATRAMAGESGLIPRRNMKPSRWPLYPQAVRIITDAIGVDGLVEIGAVGHEVGSTSHLQNDASSLMGCLGRGTGVALDLVDPEAHREDIDAVIQFSGRSWYGVQRDGPGLVSGRGVRLPDLKHDTRAALVARVDSLDDPEKTLRVSSLQCDDGMFGFMLHYDNRLGMGGDTGPYHLANRCEVLSATGSLGC